MLEWFLIMIGVFIPLGMAVHKRRSRKGFVVIPVNASITLSTLASADVIAASLIPALGEDFFAISADLQWSIRSLTAGEGPLSVGVSHGDYTVGELKEHLDLQFADPDDKIAQEQKRRLVRRSAVFAGLASEESINNGNMKRIKIKIRLGDTQTLDIWCHNLSGATLTTGAVIRVVGQVYGRWLY